MGFPKEQIEALRNELLSLAVLDGTTLPDDWLDGVLAKVAAAAPAFTLTNIEHNALKLDYPGAIDSLREAVRRAQRTLVPQPKTVLREALDACGSELVHKHGGLIGAIKAMGARAIELESTVRSMRDLCDQRSLQVAQVEHEKLALEQRVAELESAAASPHRGAEPNARDRAVSEACRESKSREQRDGIIAGYRVECAAGGQHAALDAIDAELVRRREVDDEELANCGDLLDFTASLRNGGFSPAGREAEELRQGIACLAAEYRSRSLAPLMNSVRAADELQKLLDDVDARDSLAFLERHNAKWEKRIDELSAEVKARAANQEALCVRIAELEHLRQAAESDRDSARARIVELVSEDVPVSPQDYSGEQVKRAEQALIADDALNFTPAGLRNALAAAGVPAHVAAVDGGWKKRALAAERVLADIVDKHCIEGDYCEDGVHPAAELVERLQATIKRQAAELQQVRTVSEQARRREGLDKLTVGELEHDALALSFRNDIRCRAVITELARRAAGIIPVFDESLESLDEIIAQFRTGRILLSRPQVEKLIAAVPDALTADERRHVRAFVAAADAGKAGRYTEIVAVAPLLRRLYPEPAPKTKTARELADQIWHDDNTDATRAALDELVRRAEGGAHG